MIPLFLFGAFCQYNKHVKCVVSVKPSKVQLREDSHFTSVAFSVLSTSLKVN